MKNIIQIKYLYLNQLYILFALRIIQSSHIQYFKILISCLEKFITRINTNDKESIYDKICQQINSESKSKKIFKEQIVSLIQNNNIFLEECISLLNKDKLDGGLIVEKLDEMIENKYNTVNTLKQIKSTFLNFKEEDEPEVVKPFETKPENTEFSHLHEIEYKRDEPVQQSLENKINMVNINYYELKKGEEDTKDLKMNLIYELEQFQRFKEEGSTLEDLLNN